MSRMPCYVTEVAQHGMATRVGNSILSQLLCIESTRIRHLLLATHVFDAFVSMLESRAFSPCTHSFHSFQQGALTLVHFLWKMKSASSLPAKLGRATLALKSQVPTSFIYSSTTLSLSPV